MAVLITFRQNLIAELENPTAADIMMIDTTLVGYYNFVRVHQTLKTTPAVASGIADHEWTVDEVVGLLDSN